MNEYLKENVGVTNTNFENPHGLFNQNHLTTAQDFAKITQYAIQNKTFKEIFETKELKWKGQTWDTTLFNHHKLMREMPYEGVNGGKTGYVNQSGHTLVTTAKRGKLNLIAVTFKGSSQTAAYSDTVNLLDYGFENYQTSSISKGKTYEIDKKKFVAPRNLYYSHPIRSKVKEVMNKNGTLELINEDQEVISEFSLDLIKKTEKKVEPTAVTDASSKSNPLELENYVSKIMILSIGLAAGLIGFFYNQVRKI
jgi:D-alanyl-D-alanine carboxypeptidase